MTPVDDIAAKGSIVGADYNKAKSEGARNTTDFLLSV